MIFAILTIVAANGAGLQMRSARAFENLAACEAFVRQQAPARAEVRAALERRLGMPVTLDAHCAELRPGRPA